MISLWNQITIRQNSDKIYQYVTHLSLISMPMCQCLTSTANKAVSTWVSAHNSLTSYMTWCLHITTSQNTVMYHNRLTSELICDHWSIVVIWRRRWCVCTNLCVLDLNSSHHVSDRVLIDFRTSIGIVSSYFKTVLRYNLSNVNVINHIPCQRLLYKSMQICTRYEPIISQISSSHVKLIDKCNPSLKLLSCVNVLTWMIHDTISNVDLNNLNYDKCIIHRSHVW